MLRNLATPLLVASAVRASAGLVSGWRVLNECAIDTDDRILKDFTVNRIDDNTPASCIASCSAQGYTHAGVEDGMECYCGNGVEDDIESVKVSECDLPCSGDASQKCGGDWRISLYTSGSSDRPATPLPMGWGMVADCAVDVADRLFTDTQITRMEQGNTPLVCATHCADQGFAFSSVENGRECHCGNGLARLVTPRPVSDCYMQCPGDAEQECGGPWAAQIYSDLSRVPSSPAPVPSGSAFAPPPPLDPADIALGLPAGWRTAYACAANGDPQLLEDVNMLRDNTPARCASLCQAKGFRAAGVEYAGICACGDEFEDLPALRPRAACGIPCPRDPRMTCGGEWHVQLYTRDMRLVPAVTALLEDAAGSSVEATIVSEETSSASTADATTWMVGNATSTGSPVLEETSTASSDAPSATGESTDAETPVPTSSNEVDATAGAEDVLSTSADALPTDTIASSDTLSSSATVEGELSTGDATSDASSTSTGAEESASSAAEDDAFPTDVVENDAAAPAQPEETAADVAAVPDAILGDAPAQ